jgi:hypothetical protein
VAQGLSGADVGQSRLGKNQWRVISGEWLETLTKILEFSFRLKDPLFATPDGAAEVQRGAVRRFVGFCGIYRRGEANGYMIVGAWSSALLRHNQI